MLSSSVVLNVGYSNSRSLLSVVSICSTLTSCPGRKRDVEKVQVPCRIVSFGIRSATHGEVVQKLVDVVVVVGTIVRLLASKYCRHQSLLHQGVGRCKMSYIKVENVGCVVN